MFARLDARGSIVYEPLRWSQAFKIASLAYHLTCSKTDQTLQKNQYIQNLPAITK